MFDLGKNVSREVFFRETRHLGKRQTVLEMSKDVGKDFFRQIR